MLLGAREVAEPPGGKLTGPPGAGPPLVGPELLVGVYCPLFQEGVLGGLLVLRTEEVMPVAAAVDSEVTVVGTVVATVVVAVGLLPGSCPPGILMTTAGAVFTGRGSSILTLCKASRGTLSSPRVIVFSQVAHPVTTLTTVVVWGTPPTVTTWRDVSV